jgi:transcriptional regulator with AAA-type ATPase domain
MKNPALGAMPEWPGAGDGTFCIVDRPQPSGRHLSPPRHLLAAFPGGLQLYPLPPNGALLAGREPSCQIVLDHPSISAQHARLEIGAVSRIMDVGSRDGVYFRGQRLRPHEPHEVQPGEAYTLGAVSILFLPPGAHLALTPTDGGSHLRVDNPTANDSSGLLASVAKTTSSVLIFGETGVGKELLASRIHALSGRSGPFVAINCAALSETLVESELFGHEKGAFTGAHQVKEGLLRAAAGGTLFLDEIGEMSPSIQAKLLRAIETQSIVRVGSAQTIPIDVRFVGATHRDLLDAGTFRRDLYYRLAGFTFLIPPLRERRAQIIELSMELLAAATANAAGRSPSLTPAACVTLTSHDWPGNVRELRNVITRALLLSQGRDIDASHIVFDTARSRPLSHGDNERSRILAALEACAGNQTRAADILGISRTSLVQKIRLHDIPRPRPRR